MSILGVILALLKLAGIVTDWAKQNQLINAGHEAAIGEAANAVLAKLDLANKAIAAAKAPAGTSDAEWAARMQDAHTRDR